MPEKTKKKPHPPVVKKSGFVTNTNVKPRPISDEDSEADSEINPGKKKNILGKKPVPNNPPKVLPKKSATAKPIAKSKSNLSKSKRFVDTESEESELDEPSVSKPTSKAAGSSNTQKSGGGAGSKSSSKKGKTRAGLKWRTSCDKFSKMMIFRRYNQ